MIINDGALALQEVIMKQHEMLHRNALERKVLFGMQIPKNAIGIWPVDLSNKVIIWVALWTPKGLFTMCDNVLEVGLGLWSQHPITAAKKQSFQGWFRILPSSNMFMYKIRKTICHRKW